MITVTFCMEIEGVKRYSSKVLPTLFLCASCLTIFCYSFLCLRYFNNCKYPWNILHFLLYNRVSNNDRRNTLDYELDDLELYRSSLVASYHDGSCV